MTEAERAALAGLLDRLLSEVAGRVSPEAAQPEAAGSVLQRSDTPCSTLLLR